MVERVFIMSKFFAHVVFDSDDGSIGLADSGFGDAMVLSHTAERKGLPFSEIDLLELAAMNSHHENF